MVDNSVMGRHCVKGEKDTELALSVTGPEKSSAPPRGDQEAGRQAELRLA